MKTRLSGSPLRRRAQASGAINSSADSNFTINLHSFCVESSRVEFDSGQNLVVISFAPHRVASVNDRQNLTSSCMMFRYSTDSPVIQLIQPQITKYCLGSRLLIKLSHTQVQAFSSKAVATNPRINQPAVNFWT